MENQCYSLKYGHIKGVPENAFQHEETTIQNTFNAGANKIHITQTSAEGYTIRWVQMDAREPDTVRMNTSDRTVLHISLLCSHYMEFAFFGQMVFHERDFNLIHFPEGFIDYYLEKGSSCQFLEIDLPPQTLFSLADDFPVASMFLTSARYAKIARYSAHNYIADLNILKLLDQLQDQHHGHPVHTLELLRQISDACFIKLFSYQRPIKNRQRIAHLDKVYSAAHYLSGRLHPVCMEELASRLGLTIFQLRFGFRKVYGHTLKTHHQEVKMREAARLLNKKDYSLKELSDILGYYPQNLCRTFKSTFGYTPKFSRQ